MKSGFKMRSGNASSFKMMGSSLAKGKGKAKKSKVAVDGQIEDAQSDYERDLKNTSNSLTKNPVGPVATKKNKNINSEKSDVPHHSVVPTFSDFIEDAQNKKKSKK